MSGSGSHTNTWPTNKVLNYKLSMDSMIRDVPSEANQPIQTQHYTCKMLDEMKYRTGGGCEWYKYICWGCHNPTHFRMAECDTKNIVHIISSERLMMPFPFFFCCHRCRCCLLPHSSTVHTSRLNQKQTIQLPIFIENHSNAQ